MRTMVDMSILFRLNWLFVVFIYLSVNGQVFATTIHICSEMAMTSSVLSSTQTNINIHDHHEVIKEMNKDHDSHKSAIMDNCQCIDCDCVQNIYGQANSSLLLDNKISDYFPVISIVLDSLNQNFISLPNSNLYKPPITA